MNQCEKDIQKRPRKGETFFHPKDLTTDHRFDSS